MIDNGPGRHARRRPGPRGRSRSPHVPQRLQLARQPHLLWRLRRFVAGSIGAAMLVLAVGAVPGALSGILDRHSPHAVERRPVALGSTEATTAATDEHRIAHHTRTIRWSTATRFPPRPHPSAFTGSSLEPSPAEGSDTPSAPAEVPTSASGDLRVVDGGSDGGSTAETTIAFRVEIEGELPFSGPAVARFVEETLAHERGWGSHHDVAFQRSDDAAELRVILASPDLTDELCLPLDTRGKLSCRIGDRVVLNATRWAHGVPDYADDLEAYRAYLVNHEVGHFLGYGHDGCPGPGEPAPVMMQQTKGVGACDTNPWPAVTGG